MKLIWSICLLLAITSSCTGCIANESVLTPTPDFITAVLPTSVPALPTSTPDLTAPVMSTTAPTLSAPVEGTTTSEINIRAQPSTAGTILGTIGIFTKVQISGKDSTGSWYQIAYADSSGWIRAEYVQVNSKDEIPVIAAASPSASGISGSVTQKINVRNGPGTNFESLGALNPNDVVFITGRDPDGKWVQIEFANAPAGKGWAAVEFLKIGNTDSLPVINAAEQAAATPLSAPAAGSFPASIQDGDSMQMPLAVIVFSPAGARAFQLNGSLSALNGDGEDWIQFTSENAVITIKVLCTNSGLHIELSNNEMLVNDFMLPCGGGKIILVTPNIVHHLRISEPNTNEFQYTNYTLNMESMR